MDDKIDSMPTQMEPTTTSVRQDSGNTYQKVDHPKHYNNYNIEVIDMMEKIWGTQMVAIWCLLTSFKYRMRMGTKPGESVSDDLQKEHWYLNKYQELLKKLNK